MKNSLKWAAIGLALVLPGACRLESPPDTHDAFELACPVFCDRGEDCLENYNAEVCDLVCVSFWAGQECDVDDAKLAQCLADIEAMTCEEVADVDLPEICFEACGGSTGNGGTGGAAGTGGTGGTGGTLQCDDGAHAAVDSAECDTCRACAAEGPCLGDFQACLSSQSCQDFVACVDGCSDDQCTRACVDDDPTGAALFVQAGVCAFCDHCPNNCDAAGSTFCQ